jgi:ribosome-binding ATPase YchF (GTP1/OBG family)
MVNVTVEDVLNPPAANVIAAEVTAYDDLVALGSFAKAREAGKLRIEGKEYVVKDGDVMHFLFNV